MDFKDSVDNGNVPAIYFKDDNLAHPDRFLGCVSQEKQITSMKSRFHRSTGNCAEDKNKRLTLRTTFLRQEF